MLTAIISTLLYPVAYYKPLGLNDPPGSYKKRAGGEMQIPKPFMDGSNFIVVAPGDTGYSPDYIKVEPGEKEPPVDESFKSLPFPQRVVKVENGKQVVYKAVMWTIMPNPGSFALNPYQLDRELYSVWIVSNNDMLRLFAKYGDPKYVLDNFETLRKTENVFHGGGSAGRNVLP